MYAIALFEPEEKAAQEAGHRIWIVVLRPELSARRRPDKHAGWRFLLCLVKSSDLVKSEESSCKMTSTTCPECEAELTLPNGVMENELIACPECGAELEVISLNPVELVDLRRMSKKTGANKSCGSPFSSR